MIRQMTVKERDGLKRGNFDELWSSLWGINSNLVKYKKEESISREKFMQLVEGICIRGQTYSLQTMVDEMNAINSWNEPEWGFPKGRSNYQEKDYDCAIREFCEETGYSVTNLNNVHNVLPFEEIFTGSNYKSYKHKYYLMNIDYNVSMQPTNFEKLEVSQMEWKTFENCLSAIRPYNLEKKNMIGNVNKCLKKYIMLRFNIYSPVMMSHGHQCI